MVSHPASIVPLFAPSRRTVSACAADAIIVLVGRFLGGGRRGPVGGQGDPERHKGRKGSKIAALPRRTDFIMEKTNKQHNYVEPFLSTSLHQRDGKSPL